MKFCRQCGFQLNDSDKFCAKCGAPSEPINSSPVQNQSVIGQTQATPSSDFTYFEVPQPKQNEALLVITCNSVYSKGSVSVRNFNAQGITTTNGEKNIISVRPGAMTISYIIDRGPCLTLFAARAKSYSKSLFFHPGEVIVMQVSIGSEINSTSFQSSLGFQIV